MELSDDAERILDMLSARLDKIDSKLDRAVEKIPILVAHDHTSANCPLAERVGAVETHIDRASGAIDALKIVSAILTLGVAVMGAIIGWLEFSR